MSQRFANLAEYAEYQGAPESAFIAAGWEEGVHQNRPCFTIPTKTGTRRRYNDGRKPKYKSPENYPPCWYNLDRAVVSASETGMPIIWCNGESGTITADWFGLPAICIPGGEKSRLPAHLLNELKTKYPEGKIWVVFDTDKTGRDAAPLLAQKLMLAGYAVRAIDLQLPNEGGDIANFCKSNPVDTFAELAALPDLPPAPAKPQHEPAFIQNTETSPELIQALAAALNAPPPKANNFSRQNIRCPFPENHKHGDESPSAGFIWSTGAIFCQACGYHNYKAVAERLGIDWRRYCPQNMPHPASRKPAPASNAQFTEFTEDIKKEPEAAPAMASDLVILEGVAPTYTPSTAMLVRVVDELSAAGKRPTGFCRADLRKLVEQAGFSMTTNTFNSAYKWFVELKCQKSRTGKKSVLQHDFFDILPDEQFKKNLKTAIWTALVKKAFPESHRAAALIEFFPQMIIDTLDTDDDTAALIIAALNAALPLPEGFQEKSRHILDGCIKEFRSILKNISDGTATRLDPAELSERARSNPSAYLDALRIERAKPYNGRQVSGKKRNALMGIRDPRQRYRKEKALGIIAHQQTVPVEIQHVNEIERARRSNNYAHPLRLIAVTPAGEQTAYLPIADDRIHSDFLEHRKAEFIALQRQSGHRVIVELQAYSRIEIGTPPERQRVSRELRVVESKPKSQPPDKVMQVESFTQERLEEVPGRYTEHWLKFHLLRRLVRDERGFYTNPATGEIIPNDLTGSLAELIEALTGYRLTQRKEQTA